MLARLMICVTYHIYCGALMRLPDGESLVVKVSDSRDNLVETGKMETEGAKNLFCIADLLCGELACD